MNFNNTTLLTETLGTPGESYQHSCTLVTGFAINSVLAGSICVLGLVGNSVSFLVLNKDRETPVASFLLQSLALSDNTFLLLWLLHFSLTDWFNYFRLAQMRCAGWLYVRLYTYPLLFVGQTCTIWLTVLIAISRYIAICKPYKAAQFTNLRVIRKGVALVVGFSFLYNVPRFFEAKLAVSEDDDRGNYRFTRTPLGDSQIYNMIYFDILYYIFCFVLPLLVLAVLNTKLTVAYRVYQRRRRAMRMRTDGMDHNLTLVMIIVVLVFMLCNLPARVVQIVWKYRPQLCPTFAYFLMELSNVLEVLNSSTNFIIYCVFRRQFREILHARFCLDGVRREMFERPLTSTHVTALDNECEV